MVGCEEGERRKGPRSSTARKNWVMLDRPFTAHITYQIDPDQVEEFEAHGTAWIALVGGERAKMADTSQDEGWWEASNGKWYAREKHADPPGTA